VPRWRWSDRGEVLGLLKRVDTATISQVPGGNAAVISVDGERPHHEDPATYFPHLETDRKQSPHAFDV
jgi:hypothetical protein